MHDFGSTNWPLASRRRLWLALYLDYLLIGGPLEVAVWALEPLVPGLTRASFAIRVAVVSVLELALLGPLDWSPGRRALGIVRRADPPGQAYETPERRRALVVDPRLLDAERWWTISLGIFLVLDGTKLLFRWTQWSRPMPFLGMALDGPTSAVFQVMLGVAGCVVGVGVLRLRPRAVMGGFVLMAVVLYSVLSSWALLPDWIAQDVTARRALQGRVPRPGEVEFMKAVVPRVSVLFAALTIGWLGLTLGRAKRAQANPE